MVTWPTPDPIALHAKMVPDKIACVDLASEQTWTYRELDQSVSKASGYLRNTLGVGAGKRVASIARNSADLLILQQATMRLGAIFVPLNWRLSRSEQAEILLDCDPVVVITDEDVGPMTLPPGCRPTQFPEFVEGCRTVDAAEKLALPPLDAPIIILYTSGTTGRPKGVLITGANILATAVNFGIIGHVGHDSVFLCDTPMFHVIGLITSLQAPIFQGGRVLISAGFDPVTTNARLADADFAVTHYFCVPQMANTLRSAANFEPQRWRTLKALFTGGAPNPPADILWWLDRGIRVVDGYGMTEVGTLLGMSLDDRMISAKAGAVGLPPPLVSLRIADEFGADVSSGIIGEIQVLGPNVTPGYWGKPEETSKALTPDGWFKTGDLARTDSDGFITIVGRLKDMFISGGENVYPGEIEQVLMQHPDIVEAAVLGVPNDRWGEVGSAYVVLTAGSQEGAESLTLYCAQHLARFKIPKQFTCIEKLPRNGAGKVLKNELK